MPPKTFIRQIAGVFTEIKGVVTSSGATNAGDFPALDDAGRLDASLMPTGIAADTSAVQASEALAAGDIVNVYNSAGNPRCRKADASAAGKEGHGFVLAAVSNGANATIFHEGRNNQVSGLTAGAVYLSASTPGGVTVTPPSGASQVIQRLGVAVSATEINFEADTSIVLSA